MKKVLTFIAVAAGAFWLDSCSHGGGGSGQVPTAIAFAHKVDAMASTPQDRAEPIDIASIGTEPIASDVDSEITPS